MSRTRNVYVGPYARATYRQETEVVPAYGCVTPACVGYKARVTYNPARRKGFCPDCGQALGPSTVRREVRRALLDVLGGEPLTTATDSDRKYLYAIPNGMPRGAPRHCWISEEADVVEDLASVDRGLEMQWFEEAYAEELTKMRAAYDDVVVGWGFHQWWS